MKTIVLEAPGRLRLSETPEPAPLRPDEALVGVRRVGICGTDLHAYQGDQAFFAYPRVLGHELGVEVLAVGEAAGAYELGVGDRCAVVPYLHDGSCVACRRGKPNCCVNLRVLGVHIDGGMRERLVLPLSHLIAANTLPYDHLAQVEMLAIGAHAVWRAQLEPDETVLVVGAGPIGLGTMVFARAQGARVFATDLNKRRLDFVRAQGLAQVVDSALDRGNTLSNLQDTLDGDLPTAVFDATGSPRAMMKAVDYVAHGGRLVFVGHSTAELRFSNPELHKREITLLCSRNATRQDFVQVLASLARGDVALDPWLTHHATPKSLVRDFASWLEPESSVIKAVLEF